LIGLNGLDLFGSFWGNAKKNSNDEAQVKAEAKVEAKDYP
jgi:hypothetical protein